MVRMFFVSKCFRYVLGLFLDEDSSFFEELSDHRSLTFVMWVSPSTGLEEAREYPLVQEWGSNPETPDQ